MRKKQVRLLYGICGIQILGIGFMVAGKLADVDEVVGEIADHTRDRHTGEKPCGRGIRS